MKLLNLVSLSLLLPVLGCVRPKDPPKHEAKPVPANEGEANPTMPKPGNETSPMNPGTPPEEVPVEPEGTVVTYPEADAELGEAIQPDELVSAKAIQDIIEKQIRSKYTDGSKTTSRALRDAHPKMHGCVKATFEVDPNIDPQFAHGVLAKGNKFDAVIRYSNSSHKPTNPDYVKDGRGMAMKLFDVPGKKLLDVESQAKTQDFIFISHPVFFTDNPKKYVDFINNFEEESLVKQGKTLIALGITGAKIASDIISLEPSSAIQTQYFSNVPYQLGAGAAKKAVKYTVKSCGTDAKNERIKSDASYINGDYTSPDKKDPNYLRTRLVEHFKTSDACLEMFVQYRKDNSMSVENSMIEWKSEWHKVATIRAKKGEQDIVSSPDLNIPTNKACDTLSFNPWHSLPEHKPLGSMNRIRKVVYEHISKLRHELNNEPRKEPTSFPAK